MPSRSRSAAASVAMSDSSSDDSMSDCGGIASESTASSSIWPVRRDVADQSTPRVASSSPSQPRPRSPKPRLNPKSVSFGSAMFLNDNEPTEEEDEDENTLVSSEDGERNAILSSSNQSDHARRKGRDSELDELEDLERELGMPDGGKESRASRRRQGYASTRLAHFCPSFLSLILRHRQRHAHSPRWTLSPKSAPRLSKLVIILASLILALAASGVFLTKSDYHRKIVYKVVGDLYWPSTKSDQTPTTSLDFDTEFDYITAAEGIINKTAIERKPNLLTGRVYSDDFLEFAASTVLTIKSGAAVFYQRMPLHLVEEDRNSLISNQLIFADFSGEIGGVPVIDSLANLSTTLQDEPEFAPYREIQLLKSHNVPMEKMSGGWKLDKYKFLPLHGYTYRAFPNATFGIHIEGDTYLIQEGLLRYLYEMDPDEQIFMGSVALINNYAFAHGGSGYVISRGLIQAAWGPDPYLEDKYEWMGAENCCGDYMLSEVFRDLRHKPEYNVDVESPNVDTWGRFQGTTPMDLLHDVHYACSPIFTFHHVTPEDTHALYLFEKSMYPSLPPDDYIRRIDVFDYFYPKFLREAAAEGVTSFVQAGWLAKAEDREANIGDDGSPYYDLSAEQCEKRCQDWDACITWSLRHPNAKGDGNTGCWIGDRIRFGKAEDGYTSGFLLDRIADWRSKRTCRTDPGYYNVATIIPDDENAIAQPGGFVEYVTQD